MMTAHTTTLDLALDLEYAGPRIRAALAHSQLIPEQLQLGNIRLLRHKPGRRALIAYDLRCQKTNQIYTVLGKLRTKGVDKATYRLQGQLVALGFGADTPDGIMVPQPLGLIPELDMWLQEHVSGQLGLDGLVGTQGIQLATRIAEAAHKLHQTRLVPRRSHTMADELTTLARRLDELAEQQPQLATRLGRVMHACRKLGLSVAVTPSRGIHRDFYFDQLLVDQQRLYLIDLDLYSLGDPALDIGNFIAHLTEYALRSTANPETFAGQEQALSEHFLQLNKEASFETVQAYTILSLARHITISSQFASRRHTTLALLELCEQRLGLHP